MSQKKKICFIVQRYGLEVNGGAEFQARQMAEKLAPLYDVTVYTTMAIDYTTWSNAYQNQEEELNGVRIKRFAVEHPRRSDVFDAINARFMQGKLHGEKWENAWFEAQGPYVPKMLEALKQAKENNAFNAYLVFTYLYYTSVYALPILKEKVIFIPEAHDEPFLRLKRVREEFQYPYAFFFNTEEEKNLVHSNFRNERIPYAIGGAGVDLPDNIDKERFISKYKLQDTPYLIYVGRIDEGKNCGEMFRYWQAYKQRNPGNLKLVLMGKSAMEVPEREDILNLGFVSDEDKFDGMAGARFLWLPSKFESLSMVVLESMLVSVPVVVNGACEVLKAHCSKSNAGFYYANYLEFEGVANRLLHDPQLYAAMAENAPAYVNKYYNWDVIIHNLSELIEGLSEVKQ